VRFPGAVPDHDIGAEYYEHLHPGAQWDHDHHRNTDHDHSVCAHHRHADDDGHAVYHCHVDPGANDD
jgi:hypothetical protein